MQLSEIFDQLVYGELSQIGFIGSNEEQKVTTENYPKMVAYINSGLTALYTRFYLKEGRLTLNLVEGLQDYILSPKYNASGKLPTIIHKYIDDSERPFVGDLLRIEAIATDLGTQLPINDSTYPESVFTPTMDSLRVPKCLVDPDKVGLREDLHTENLEVTYRANHPKITVGLGYFDPARVEIELPYSHMQALLFYVASRVYSTNGMVEEGIQGSSFFAKYEHECRLLENANMSVVDESLNMRLINAGWV